MNAYLALVLFFLGFWLFFLSKTVRVKIVSYRKYVEVRRLVHNNNAILITIKT